MAGERWYPTGTPLRNGEMLITSGRVDLPEVRTTGGTLRPLITAQLGLPLYPWIDVAPDGRAFYSGPDPTMRKLDTNGTGTWETFGQRDAVNPDYGSHALYDIGKVLVAGGEHSVPTARVIDINGATPQSTATGSMANGRRPAQPHRAGRRDRAGDRRPRRTCSRPTVPASSRPARRSPPRRNSAQRQRGSACVGSPP
jgi:hypothetical protein